MRFVSVDVPAAGAWLPPAAAWPFVAVAACGADVGLPLVPAALVLASALLSSVAHGDPAATDEPSASICRCQQGSMKTGFLLAIQSANTCCTADAHDCVRHKHWPRTLAATLSLSRVTSIFSFMAVSYFFFSSRMVGSYLA